MLVRRTLSYAGCVDPVAPPIVQQSRNAKPCATRPPLGESPHYDTIHGRTLPGGKVAQTRRNVSQQRERRGVAHFAIERHLEGDSRSTLVADVRRGLGACPKNLPAKYLYDERGALLFDAICDQPEYYPTRTEERMLAEMADEAIRICRPNQLVELGSGASRKTRLLLDALSESGGDQPSYVPVDVSAEMLSRSADAVRRDYPELAVHAIVGDYERDLRCLPPADRRMVIFLGSTIGNFTEIDARRFLRSLRAQLSRGDWLLMGFDLVKPVEVLNAAYNDAAGVTADFNKNVLHVLNRELDANFDLDSFRHDAFFNAGASQIEMHLRTDRRQLVSIPGAGLEIAFAAGESVRTEISRKFTKSSATGLVAGAGFAPRHWYQSSDGYFALLLASAAVVV